MKEPKELLNQCKHYGKKDGYSFFASYEQSWIQFTILDRDFLQEVIDDYKLYGLEDFNTEDNVPIGIKAILYNRHRHWGDGSDGVESFKRWYVREYLARS